MKNVQWALPAVLAMLGPVVPATNASAVQMQASYQLESGNVWHVDLGISNDGLPPEISEFTVYFDQALFSDLVLLASPAGWDSLVIQRNLYLDSAGYLDSLVIDPAHPLTAGQSQGGFSVQFTWLGSGAPPSLPFDIVDPTNYGVPIASGTTSAVPEPASACLWFAGLVLLGGIAARASRAPGASRPVDLASRSNS